MNASIIFFPFSEDKFPGCYKPSSDVPISCEDKTMSYNFQSICTQSVSSLLYFPPFLLNVIGFDLVSASETMITLLILTW